MIAVTGALGALGGAVSAALAESGAQVARTLDIWDSLYRMNLRTAVACCKAAMPHPVKSSSKNRGITVDALLRGTIDTPRNRSDRPKADFSRWVAPASIGAVTGALIPVTGKE